MRKLLFLLLLLLLLLIAPVWAPVHLSYVYSDSMAPTINEGDGYILVPAGEVTPGEIITFYSPKRNAYITHRVVKETPAGFITKGDNNPVTDQATGLQPVDRSQIVGEVLTIGGTPIIIPHLGTLLGVFKSIQNIVIAGLLLAFTYSFLTANEGNQRPKRHVIKTRDIYRAVFIGVAIIGVSFILLSASTAGFAYTVPHEGEETTVRTYYIKISKSPITNSIIVIGQGSLKSIDRLSHAELAQIKSQDTKQSLPIVSRYQQKTNLLNIQTTNVYKVWVEVPQTQDRDLVSIRVYTHPALIPTPILRRLHHIHAFIAAVASVGSVLVPLYMGYRIFVDKERPLHFRSEYIRSYLRGDSP